VPHINKPLARFNKRLLPTGASHRDGDYKLPGELLVASIIS